MALIELKTDPTASEVRWFAALWLPLAGAIFAAVTWYATGSTVVPVAIVSFALAVAALGLLVPKAGRVALIAWMYATYPLGWAMSHLILGTIYFGVMTPIGLLRRLLQRDPLGLRIDRAATTYWVPRRRVDDLDAYFRRF
ncbi:MAG: hypothetical protein FJ144_25305 [Deltaproteobacteria bacterium]|nr:hypothetical protein [Deltaproteobacteria bacterium]